MTGSLKAPTWQPAREPPAPNDPSSKSTWIWQPQSVWSSEYRDPNRPFHETIKPTPTPVVVPLDGFTVQTTANGMSVSLNAQQPGYWSQYWLNIKEGDTWQNGPATVQATYSLQTHPVVDPVSDVVTFPGDGAWNVTQAGAPDWLAQVFGAVKIPDDIINRLSNVL